MSKKILQNDARIEMQKGIQKVAGPVLITLGPRGQNVALERKGSAPKMTCDGISVAREISLSDPYENMGAEGIKSVGEKINEEVGDNTTTGMGLYSFIIEEGMKKLALGVNGELMRRGIEKARDAVIVALQEMAKPCKTEKEMAQIASISSKNNEHGAIIAKVIKDAGEHGSVTVEEHQLPIVKSQIVQGMEIDKGYAAPFAVTRSDRMQAIFENTPILIMDKKVEVVDVVNIILDIQGENVRVKLKHLVIIADDFSEDVLKFFMVNKLQQSFYVLPIKSPGYGPNKKEVLGDIAIAVGAKIHTIGAVGVKLGMASKIISTKDKTTIFSGKGKKEDVNQRIQELKSQLETAGGYEKEKLNQRIAQLSGGVAVILVGAATPNDLLGIKDKIEDAVVATQNAVTGGIVPGGGVALIKATQNSRMDNFNNPEEIAGANILLDALKMPLKQIAINAARGDGSVIVDKVANGKGYFGYDALHDVYVKDMLKEGIVDTAKGLIACVRIAATDAALFLSCGSAVAEEVKEK